MAHADTKIELTFYMDSIRTSSIMINGPTKGRECRESEERGKTYCSSQSPEESYDWLPIEIHESLITP